MKMKSLILILVCWFALAPGYSSAQVTVQLGTGQENDWYQGHQGQWQHQGNSWQWRSTHGNDWYQGRPGAWYRDQDNWQYYGNDGYQYRQRRHVWRWYDRYGHYHQSYEHGPHGQQ
jgi:hypothetical protein